MTQSLRYASAWRLLRPVSHSNGPHLLHGHTHTSCRWCACTERMWTAWTAAAPSKVGRGSLATTAAACSSSSGNSAAQAPTRWREPVGAQPEENPSALRRGPGLESRAAATQVPRRLTSYPPPSHTHPPPSTAATPPPPRPLRSPSLDWSRDKSNGKRPAGTLPGDPRCDRTGPKAFPCLAGAPNPLPQPRAPLPDFRKFAKNSPHEFSCPADPRWRRIHRGGCWEQDLYPLTPAVTPVVPGFPQGGGGRWELRSRSGPGWGRVDFFPRLREWVGRGVSLRLVPPSPSTVSRTSSPRGS